MDSDESVCSDDVLESSYPVKPRKILSNEKGCCLNKRSSSSRTALGVDEMLAFIQMLSKNNTEIYEAEAERERLESWTRVCALICCSICCHCDYTNNLLSFSLIQVII